MRVSVNKREFVDDPIGACVVDRSWFACCPDAQLWALVLWGSFTLEDTESLVDLFRIERGLPERVGLIDTRYMEPPDAASFAVFTSYVRGRTFERFARKVAIVHGQGPAGAMAAGFPKVIEVPFPIELFTDLTAALAWLDRPDPAAAEQLEHMQERWSGMAPLVRAIRVCIGEALVDVTIESAAAQLGLSVRTLQRRLGELGTSFRDEVGAVRLEAAMRMLTTSESIAAIAFATGWGSTQHFATAFRKHTGLAPTEWRARHRR